MPRSKHILKVVISWMFVTMLIASPLEAKSHNVPVRKAIPVEQAKTPAKVVSGDGTQTALVVLPPGFEHHDVVVADSQEYKDLLSKNKDLQKQVQDDEAKLAAFSNSTNRVQKDQVEALKAEQKHGSSLFSYLHWISWIGGGSMILGVAAIIALCVFCPAAIPLVEEWIVAVFKAFFRVLKDLAEDIAALIPKKKAAVPTSTPTPKT